MGSLRWEAGKTYLLSLTSKVFCSAVFLNFLCLNLLSQPLLSVVHSKFYSFVYVFYAVFLNFSRNRGVSAKIVILLKNVMLINESYTNNVISRRFMTAWIASLIKLLPQHGWNADNTSCHICLQSRFFKIYQRLAGRSDQSSIAFIKMLKKNMTIRAE